MALKLPASSSVNKGAFAYAATPESGRSLRLCESVAAPHFRGASAQDSCLCLLGRVDYFGWMDGPEQGEALKVPDVDGKQLRDPMNVHTRREPGIMNLHASDFVGHQ